MLDDPVVAFGPAVADAGANAFGDGGPPVVDGLREAAELRDVDVVGAEHLVGEALPDQRPVRFGAVLTVGPAHFRRSRQGVTQGAVGEDAGRRGQVRPPAVVDVVSEPGQLLRDQSLDQAAGRRRPFGQGHAALESLPHLRSEDLDGGGSSIRLSMATAPDPSTHAAR